LILLIYESNGCAHFYAEKCKRSGSSKNSGQTGARGKTVIMVGNLEQVLAAW
jgi:hypothetical protein